MSFVHPTRGRGRVRMIFGEDNIVKLKIKIGRVIRNFEDQPDVMAMRFTKEVALKIADKSTRLRINRKKYIAHYDDNNEMWEKRLDEIEIIKPLDLRKLAVLEGRAYKTVLYTPLPNIEANNIWVFIDAESGRMITTYEDTR